MKDIHNKAAADDTTGKKRKMNETAEEYMEVIQKIITFSRIAGAACCCSGQLRWRTGIVIELCGSWVWSRRVGSSASRSRNAKRCMGQHLRIQGRFQGRRLPSQRQSLPHGASKKKCGAEVCFANRPKGAPLLVPQAQRSRRNHQPVWPLRGCCNSGQSPLYGDKMSMQQIRQKYGSEILETEIKKVTA